MRIYRLKKMSIPKVAVLATGLAAAVMVVTINPAPAMATPRAGNCAGCHASDTGNVSTVTAVPSTATPAAGATYTVAITMSANPNGGNTGFGIVAVSPAPAPSPVVRGGPSASLSYTATMIAPAATGTYSYTVYTNQGMDDPTVSLTGSKVFTITVAAVVTTPPVTTTTPPVTTTTPPVTTTTPPVTTTTTPPVTTTTPPVTTTTPPVTTTTPPVTTTMPPVTTTVPPVTTTTPPVSSAHISQLSPNHGRVGTKVTIRGTGFAKSGVVSFGAGHAKVSFWSSTKIVVRVPSTFIVKVESKNSSSQPVWYRHDNSVRVTVTPKGAAASNAVAFRLDSRKGNHHGHDGFSNDRD